MVEPDTLNQKVAYLIQYDEVLHTASEYVLLRLHSSLSYLIARRLSTRPRDWTELQQD